MNKVYKIEADGDTVYVSAETENGAYQTLVACVGPVRRSYITITEIEQLPEDAELLNA